MIKDFEFDALASPIFDLYAEIEIELISKVCEMLLTYDGVTGALEWYTKKLDELGLLNADVIKIIAKRTGKSEKLILSMLKQAGFANIDMKALNRGFQLGLIANPAILMQSDTVKNIVNHSYKELSKSYKLINTKAIQGTNQAYMNVLNKAYIEVASGIYDYNTAIKRGLKDMASQGIKVVEYAQPNGTIRKYGIESCVRRDTLTAVNKLANEVALKGTEELGAEHVEVSSHLGARTGDGVHAWSNHASWQGKIYKIEGSDQYPNLVEVTGYGDILGLGGVNCRHRMYPFIVGASTPMAEKIDIKENERVYKATQQQRALERKIRALRRKKEVAKAIYKAEPTIENKIYLTKIENTLSIVWNELKANAKANNLSIRQID